MYPSTITRSLNCTTFSFWLNDFVTLSISMYYCWNRVVFTVTSIIVIIMVTITFTIIIVNTIIVTVIITIVAITIIIIIIVVEVIIIVVIIIIIVIIVIILSLSSLTLLRSLPPFLFLPSIQSSLSCFTFVTCCANFYAICKPSLLNYFKDLLYICYFFC